MILSDLIRLHRHKNGLLQKDLAKLVGVSSQAVLAWENKNIIPNDENLSAISNILRIDMHELFEAKHETISYKNNHYCVYKHTSPS